MGSNIASYKKNKNRNKIVVILLLVVSIFLIILGVKRYDFYDVYRQATKICYECIGIG